MISIDAKAEAEYLMNELFGFAEKMLSQHGEFHPIGGYLDIAGRMVHVGLENGVERSAGREELTLLKDSLRSIAQRSRGRIFACAANVTVKGSNAIQFFIEHKNGYCAEVFLVYTAQPGRGVAITNKFAQAGTPFFFSCPSH